MIQKYILTLWRKEHETFETHIDLQSQAIYVDNVFFKKNLHILEDGASRYIEHIVV